jgi:hypothetical protein
MTFLCDWSTTKVLKFVVSKCYTLLICSVSAADTKIKREDATKKIYDILAIL